MGVYGIAVLRFFSSGISVIFSGAVLRYHLALRYMVFHPFVKKVFSKRRSFMVLWYHLFSLSTVYNTGQYNVQNEQQ